MKSTYLLLYFCLAIFALSCGKKKEQPADGFSIERQKTNTENKTTPPAESAVKASERIDLSDKGVGPVTSVKLNPEIDADLATEGEAVYNQMCLACHRVGKRFIGPAPNGILERRTPEWVMNMILNPEGMVKDNPLAKDLLLEFNGSPMANQNLTEEQARAVLEYFRTLN